MTEIASAIIQPTPHTPWSADEIQAYLGTLPGEMGPWFWRVRAIMSEYGYGSEAMRIRMLEEMRTVDGLNAWAEKAFP
jgi:hypothetical protein